MSEHWSDREECGGRRALSVIRFVTLRCGRWLALTMLYPITLYFYFRRGPERRASREFLTRALGRRATALEVMRHIRTYAITLVDRIYLLADSTRRFEITVHGLPELDALIVQNRGVLMLGAHIGSFEILRALSERRKDIKTRILMDRQQTPELTSMLMALNPSVAASIIDVGGNDTDIALAIQDAAKQGALIGMLGDRSRPKEATTSVPFFGTPARFPVAPYLIASLLDLPVVLTFGLYRGGNRYDLYFETLADHVVIPRRERAALMHEWAARFASRLEHYTRLDPYNWFNFYDFWHRADDSAVADGKSAAVESVA
ncbi:MAG TPA: acyltransferase [Rudaea sp.]|nr:acyltransferase [Rudaea sp.]